MVELIKAAPTADEPTQTSIINYVRPLVRQTDGWGHGHIYMGIKLRLGYSTSGASSAMLYLLCDPGHIRAVLQQPLAHSVLIRRHIGG